MNFKEGFASVKQNGKWGFIDKTSKEVIPFKYEYGGVFSQGLATVKLNGTYGYIDKKGSEIVPFVYYEGFAFNEGAARVRTREGSASKWGFVDKKGKEIVPLIYDDAGDFINGKGAVRLNEKYLFFDRTGKEVNEMDIISPEPVIISPVVKDADNLKNKKKAVVPVKPVKKQ
ncbi:MAG: WG repeat-containing protein [Ferruginibacter sp.]